jgi:AcrR family transcriptional regulator
MARPRNFDRQRVVEAATAQFWRHGFHATSAEDLCQVTGLGRSSLYNTFGSKDELFAECLDWYLDTKLDVVAERMAEPERSALGRVEGLLLLVAAEELRRGPAPRGCLAVNSVAEFAADDEHAGDLKRIRRDTEARLRMLADALRVGQAAGEVTDDVTAEGLAAFVNATIAGLRISSQGGVRGERLREIVHAAVRALKP